MKNIIILRNRAHARKRDGSNLKVQMTLLCPTLWLSLWIIKFNLEIEARQSKEIKV